MLFIENLSLDPWFNLAAEEYLLKHFDSEIAMIWRSRPSIIVGKHQNTLAEINLDYVRANNIPVVRRLSGGGTVFHDPGNINFTFIKKAAKQKLVDFKAHTQPIVDFLHTIHIDARLEGKNDIRVNGLKISGNAEHVFKDKVLHHGTLLFDSDLTDLNLALKAKEESFESKAVKSIRSTVANISSFIPGHIGRSEFIFRLKEYLIDNLGNLEVYSFEPDDIRKIEALKDEKYVSWEWNFGYSPTYTFKNSRKLGTDTLSLELTVTKGKITNVELWTEETLQPLNDISKALMGIDHRPDEIENILRSFNFMQINDLDDPWKLLGLFF